MSRSRWRALRRDAWLSVTVSGALVVTMLETVLLQRRYGLFTGGFLSTQHLVGGTQTAVFLTTAVLVNAAVIGLVAATVLGATSYIGIRRSAPILAFLVSVGGLFGADFVQYRLLDYLGDAFDLGLMFDLAGQDVSEILAVSIEYLVTPVSIALSAAGTLAVAVWWYERRGDDKEASVSRRAEMRRPIALVVVAAVVSTGVRLASEPLENGVRRLPAGRVLGTLVRTVTDVDFDGFGLLARPSDPDPWRSAIYPYAVEVPGNGIDENGIGGDLPLDRTQTERTFRRVPSFTAKPDVVLVVLESFRGDLIGATHAGQSVTPTLNALKKRGVSARRAYSHNGYTVQSRFHLMSGALVPGLTTTTLVDDFQSNGYEVAYFSGQDESFGDPRLGVGFDRADVSYDARADRENRYSTFTTAGSLAVSHTLVRQRLARFLAERDDSKPLFLYLNFHDTHFPYHHREIEPVISDIVVPRGEIGPARAADLRAMYANTAANVDRTIGLVLADVTESVGAEPMILVTSDHGESLFDENFLGHGYALNDAQTLIPLIAVNLPVPVVEPFGQIHLRQILWKALETRAPDAARQVGPGRTTSAVFQYLGNMSRPRQIGEVSDEGRIIFDFRTSHARIADGDWEPFDDLSSRHHTMVLSLIHRWEAMVLDGYRATTAEAVSW